MRFVGWAAVAAVIVAAVTGALSPIIGTTALALLCGVSFRVGPASALIASFFIAIAWLIAALIAEHIVKRWLPMIHPKLRDLIANIACGAALASGYALIVERLLAAIAMAALATCLYLILSPLIDKLEVSSRKRPEDWCEDIEKRSPGGQR